MNTLSQRRIFLAAIHGLPSISVPHRRSQPSLVVNELLQIVGRANANAAEFVRAGVRAVAAATAAAAESAAFYEHEDESGIF